MDQTGVEIITLLPFVADFEPDRTDSGKSERVFWRVESSGNYRMDLEMGSAMALKALIYMRDFNCPCLLGWIVNSMLTQIKSGKVSGVEVGFMGTIARAAMRGLPSGVTFDFFMR